jgi:hypothetical protein
MQHAITIPIALVRKYDAICQPQLLFSSFRYQAILIVAHSFSNTPTYTQNMPISGVLTAKVNCAGKTPFRQWRVIAMCRGDRAGAMVLVLQSGVDVRDGFLG